MCFALQTFMLIENQNTNSLKVSNSTTCLYAHSITHHILFTTYSYQNGMMHVRKELNAETTEAIHKATDQVITLSEQKGADNIRDEDIDALLSWTDGLNFDE